MRSLEKERVGLCAAFRGLAILLASLLLAACTSTSSPANSTRVLFLGTYQGHPGASKRLLEGEARAAAAASVPLIPVSSIYAQGVAVHPDLPWHASDGMHPGPQLALLNAVLLYRESSRRCSDAGENRATVIRTFSAVQADIY